ncbi:MAG: hypothetical protein JSV36_08510 [Anaerolineae bacterium]|nr:MAG: hypothetical protein JSV36_08510 [Anaerolineae bacterium]
MDRAIPFAGNEEIELYIRTYYSLLRSTGEIQVRSLEETHAGMGSSLHLGADEPAPDISALVYAVLRLPPCIAQTSLVLLGQSDEVFDRGGYPDVERWQPVNAPGRRRKMAFDGQETLAAFIASVSDIDDMIPMLVAYQIEWNKLHQRLANSSAMARLAVHVEGDEPLSPADETLVREALAIDEADFDKLRRAWGSGFWANLLRAGRHKKRMALRLLAGSLTDYRRAAQGWWRGVERAAEFLALRDRPVYFVSSNSHSLANLLSGYAARHRETLVSFLRETNPEDLWAEYQRLEKQAGQPELTNLLYYALGIFLRSDQGQAHRQAIRLHLEAFGLRQVINPLWFDVGAQIIEVRRLKPEWFDPRLRMPGLERLAASEAAILNMDYPLGMAAYQILSQVTANVGDIRGVYIMGKAATLNGRIGDVMIPNVIYDEHSQNTFLFKNCFVAQDVARYLLWGSVFDSQKAVTVRGTFLQNREFMALFYREGYTDIEMESGPYLSAIYEDIYPRRYPANQIVNLFINAPYDIGVLHYASDTPYSRRQVLLSKSLSYFGVDSTYAASIAILRHILAHELAALG